MKFLNLIYDVMKVYVKLIYIDNEMVTNISTKEEWRECRCYM